MSNSILKNISLSYALEIIELYKLLNYDKEYVISNEFLRFGTSIGANIHEAKFAESKRDFIHKMAISMKEASETEFWIKLLIKSSINVDYNLALLLNKVQEIERILYSTINTSKLNLEK